MNATEAHRPVDRACPSAPGGTRGVALDPGYARQIARVEALSQNRPGADKTWVHRAHDEALRHFASARRSFEVEGVAIPVARLADIVASKAATGREKDRLFLATHRDALEHLLPDDDADPQR